MNASGGKPAPDSLYVRPVVEEFKAFVQHKIEVLEKFRNVDEIKVYLDALELGVKSILDVQAEDLTDLPRPAEFEFTGDAIGPDRQETEASESPDSEVLAEEESVPAEDAETGPGIETEELETQEGPAQGASHDQAGHEAEVLIGEDKPADPKTEAAAPPAENEAAAPAQKDIPPEGEREPGPEVEP